MFLAILHNQERARYDLSSLQSGIIAGSPISPVEYEEICRELEIPHLQVSYGQTEASPCIAISDYDDALELKSNTAGKAISDVELEIRRPENSYNSECGEELEALQKCEICGEIVVRGYNVMQGYYNRPEETAAAVDEEGWLHTGDMAIKDANGNIFIKGRCKNMLLTASGQNIYPEEIEARLNNMPFVNESLIILKDNKLVALIYPDNDEAFAQNMNKAELEAAIETNRLELNKQLPAYSQITRIKLYPEEFEKTAKKSIKRFMYQDIKE